MFVHDELEVGSSWQHSQNLTIQRQSSYGLLTPAVRFNTELMCGVCVEEEEGWR